MCRVVHHTQIEIIVNTRVIKNPVSIESVTFRHFCCGQSVNIGYMEINKS